MNLQGIESFEDFANWQTKLENLKHVKICIRGHNKFKNSAKRELVTVSELQFLRVRVHHVVNAGSDDEE